MEHTPTFTSEVLLEGHNEREKTAYLAAIASLATADKQASQQELEYISSLCEAAELPESQKQIVLQAAMELEGEELSKSLDILKNSQLKYSLVTDLMAFAKADNSYSEDESHYVQKVAQYLGVDQQQFGLLDQFAENIKSSSATPQTIAEPGFLSGLKQKLQGAGINTNTLFKGLLAIAGPIILSRMMRGGNRGARGGMLGGLGGLLGGAGMAGGLGSLIGMLNGGRGFSNTGGLLDRVLRGGF